MAKTIIEISGPDFVGKSTQAELLTYETQALHVHNFGSLAGYSKKMPDSLSPQEFFKWWFEKSSFNELCSALIDAYNNRLATIEKAENLDIAVVERGRDMLRAQLVATFLTRENKNTKDTVALEKITTAVENKIAKYMVDVPRDSRVEIFLKPCKPWQSEIECYHKVLRSARSEGSSFSGSQNKLYANYQKNLSTVLELQTESNSSILVDCPAVDVQNVIRAQVRKHNIPPLFANNPVIVGLAGLSETGKGAVAQFLQDNFAFTRLKIGFFNEHSRDHQKAYAKPSKTALTITHFLATNRHIQRATLESLHGTDISIALKLILGERWVPTLLTSPDTLRVQRNNSQFTNTDPTKLRRDQQNKDKTKLKQGLAEYQEHADIVVDNSGTIKQTANKIVKHIGQKRDRTK